MKTKTPSEVFGSPSVARERVLEEEAVLRRARRRARERLLRDHAAHEVRGARRAVARSAARAASGRRPVDEVGDRRPAPRRRVSTCVTLTVIVQLPVCGVASSFAASTSTAYEPGRDVRARRSRVPLAVPPTARRRRDAGERDRAAGRAPGETGAERRAMVTVSVGVRRGDRRRAPRCPAAWRATAGTSTGPPP